MNEESAPQETKGKDWTEIPELKDSRIGELLEDLKELDVEFNIPDYQVRLAGIRGLIAEELARFGVTLPVRGVGLQAQWHLASETEKWDRAKMVRDGITPEQMARWRTKGKKKAYLEIRPLKTLGSSESAS